MRTHGLVIVLALLSAGCASAHRASTAGSSSPELSPLQSCETRELKLAGADVVVTANADGSAATIQVAGAPSATARKAALGAARSAFGCPRRDLQTVAHQSKWGLVTWTDPCGHPVSGSSSH
ncbi:MAG TPA: hypothetical protein VGF86_01910 [Candidatus Tumulicola sp.]